MMHYHFCDSCSFIYSLKASIPRIQVWPSCVLPLSSLGDFSQVDMLCCHLCRDEFSTSLCGAHTQVPDYLLGTSTCTACKQLKADMFELCSLPAWSSPCIPVLMNGTPAFWSTYVRGHPGVFTVSSLLFQPSILSPANCRPFSPFLLYSSPCRVTA